MDESRFGALRAQGSERERKRVRMDGWEGEEKGTWTRCRHDQYRKRAKVNWRCPKRHRSTPVQSDVNPSSWTFWTGLLLFHRCDWKTYKFLPREYYKIRGIMSRSIFSTPASLPLWINSRKTYEFEIIYCDFWSVLKNVNVYLSRCLFCKIYM